MKAIWGRVTAIVVAVALAGLLVFSYVSAITNYDFTVFIFAGAADQETNRQLIEEWAAQYAEEHKAEIGKDSINVGISFQSDTNLYFSQVQREIASGKADDVFYVSPKYVKSFALNDAILDLTHYVDWNKYDPNGVWSQAVGAYAYVLPTTDNPNGSIGDPVTYVGDPGADGIENVALGLFHHVGGNGFEGRFNDELREDFTFQSHGCAFEGIEWKTDHYRTEIRVRAQSPSHHHRKTARGALFIGKQLFQAPPTF